MSDALSQALERQALNQAPVMIRDLNGRIQLWGSGLEQVYGYRSDECLGQLAHVLLDTQFPIPRAEIEAAVRERGAWSGELSERRSDGEAITVSSHWSLLRDRDAASVMICSNDISGVRRALHDHRLLASIVESSQDAVMGKNLQGIVTSWNGAAARMFGYAPEEIIGRPVTVLFPEHLIGEELMILERLRRGDRIEHYETVRLHKDGSPVHVSLTVSPIFDPNGVVIGASKSARDISDRIMLAKRLDELQAELLHTSRVNDMGLMASALAHELRQPLTAIFAYLGTVRRHAEAGDTILAIAACNRAQLEVGRAAAIIGRLGLFLKKDQIQCRTDALAGVLDDAISLASMGSSAKGLKIDVRIDDDAQAALVDRIQIQQVVVNLIRNAAQATEGQAVRSMLISARRQDEHVIAVEVADNGPGLTADVLAHIFEPFYTTKSDGLGIGLSLCRSIVRAHGGDMTAENAAGGGAVFRFTLLTA